MNIISIIPARGGSKGIPKKNIQKLGGKPMLAYSIEAALHAKLIDRVIVSTDDQEIADVAVEYGAEVVDRPAELAGDFASSETALLHVLEVLQQKKKQLPDLLVFLQCTSPLTLSSDIDGTIQALLNQQADTAFSAAPFHYFVWEKEADGSMVGVNHDKSKRLMRQQRQDQFVEAGAVYVMRVPGFLEYKHRFFGKTAMYEIPEERCFEIDEPVDLLIAEQMLQHQRAVEA
jgi:CMP-N-acetylneuraminic acid synthetase